VNVRLYSTPVYVNNRVRAVAFSLVTVLSACSSGSNAILQTLPYAYGRNPSVDNARLNPNYRYLRVTVDGRVALLALGEVDTDPQGPVEVWYSAEREVLRLQNGRLAGAVGLTTEWRAVSMSDLPRWSEIARAGNQMLRWTRVRDVMPGYRFGVKDVLSLRVIPEPKKTALKDLDPQRLTWFEERIEAKTGASLSGVFGNSSAVDLPLPPARYAVDLHEGSETVVYGEQCLAANLCFSWQRWPAQAQGAPDTR